MKTLHYSIIVISLILVGASSFSIAQSSNEIGGVAIPQISTSKSNFTDGDIIPINGYALPNSTINILLVNNYGNIQNSTQVKSNNTGDFNTSLGIPSHVIGGAWALFATDGDGNFAMQLMVNFHGSHTPPFNFPSGLPPLKQFKLGIKPSYVQCRSDLQLIIKSEDGSPACVKDTSIGKFVRQGWWAWNDKVGDTVVNTPDKRDFDNKSCAISETMSSIVGTNGFVKDTLPYGGITYPGVNLTGSADVGVQFAILSNSTAQIVFAYDFNPYPGSNCKVTTKDAMTYINLARSNISILNTTRSNTLISNFFISPDIFEVDATKIRTDIPPLGDSGDIQVKLVNAEDLNDHVVKVTYQIISKPSSQIGKSYLLSFWWHSAVGVTVGNYLYNGTAFSGPRFG